MGEFAASIERSKAKSVSASGGLRPLTPRPGALPLDPAGGSAPRLDPRYRLAICALAMPPALPNPKYATDYHIWGAVLEAYCKLKTKLKTSAKLKEVLQVIWGNLSQGQVDKAVRDFSNKATEGWCCNFELAVYTSNIYSDNEILAFNHYLTVLFNDVIKLLL